MNINDVHRSAVAAVKSFGAWSDNPVDYREVVPLTNEDGFAVILIDRRDGVAPSSQVFACDITLSHFADGDSLTEHLRERIGLHLRRATH